MRNLPNRSESVHGRLAQPGQVPGQGEGDQPTRRLQCVEACFVRLQLLRVTRGWAAAGRQVQMSRDQRVRTRGGACSGGRGRVTPRGPVGQGLAAIMCLFVTRFYE
jgi:hypothetical protein